LLELPLREGFLAFRRGYRSLEIIGIANPLRMVFEIHIREWEIGAKSTRRS
jgi:hypothetical protein